MTETPREQICLRRQHLNQWRRVHNQIREAAPRVLVGADAGRDTRRTTCAFLQKLGQSLIFIDGAASMNPTHSRQHDTLLHVNTKTRFLSSVATREGGRAAGRLSSPSIQVKALQGLLTSRNNLCRCLPVKPPEDHTSKSRTSGRGKTPSFRCREMPFSLRGLAGGRPPPLETSLRRTRPLASPAFLRFVIIFVTVTICPTSTTSLVTPRLGLASDTCVSDSACTFQN